MKPIAASTGHRSHSAHLRTVLRAKLRIPHDAFTLIELLVAIAIIAVPLAKEPQGRYETELAAHAQEL